MDKYHSNTFFAEFIPFPPPLIITVDPLYRVYLKCLGNFKSEFCTSKQRKELM
jgi:hypothetical protein